MTTFPATMGDATFAKASAIPRWPANTKTSTSQEYIEARNELLKEEYALRARIERVAALRRALPPGAVMPSYSFIEASPEGSTKTTTLADLAGDGRSVVLYHFMFDPADEEPCGMCSMLVDSFNGISPHLNQNINFAIIGAAPIAKLQGWALKRGWKDMRILSSHGTTFNRDMNVENPAWAKDANQIPGVSVFKKGEGGEVRHMYTAFASIEPGSERGLDLLAGTYNVLDLCPEGRGEWYAGKEYL